MSVKMATGKDLKRKSVFVAPNGQIYEGTAANYYEGTAKAIINDMGRTSETNRPPEDAGKVKKEEKK